MGIELIHLCRQAYLSPLSLDWIKNVDKNTKEQFHIHLVSDSTGETLNSIARACLVQFDHVDVEEHHWSLIRSKRQLDLVYEGFRQWPGLVLYTFVDEALRTAIAVQCQRMELSSHSVMDPIFSVMTNYFGAPPAHDPGRQHVLDADYFSRIDAMDYAMTFDDGNQAEKLDTADVVILGVSRTSKTPTAIYLSHRGIRVANIPIVPGLPLPYDLKKLKRPLIVGLTKDPDSLVDIRRSRLRFLQENQDTSYIDPEKVREEVREAKRFYAKLQCPVIDVSSRSIEETAAKIMMLMKRREMAKTISKQNEPKNA